MAMRCKRCRGPVVIEVRRHNAAFCRDCFVHYVGQQVTRAIAKYRMLGHTDRVLVAVSGGKDSLALWDLLLDLGYRADGLYLSLGIGAYSERSKVVCQEFAAARGATLLVHDLAAEHGYTIPEAAGAGGRSSCGVCGLSKRYVFNKAALDGGYDVVCAGHTQMRHKETLNQMEEAAPGTKHSFLFGYLERAAGLLRVADDAELAECARCGMTTQAPEDPAAEAVCAFCRSKARLVKTLPVVEVASR